MAELLLLLLLMPMPMPMRFMTNVVIPTPLILNGCFVARRRKAEIASSTQASMSSKSVILVHVSGSVRVRMIWPVSGSTQDIFREEAQPGMASIAGISCAAGNDDVSL